MHKFCGYMSEAVLHLTAGNGRGGGATVSLLSTSSPRKISLGAATRGLEELVRCCGPEPWPISTPHHTSCCSLTCKLRSGHQRNSRASILPASGQAKRRLATMSLKAQAFQQACRSRRLSSKASSISALSTFPLIRRSYATQSDLGGSTPSGSRTTSHRRAITVTSDDGRYNWSELSNREKAARTTQQSVNFVIVAAGAVGTVMPASPQNIGRNTH